MEITELQARLSEPFHPKRVHWRVGSTWEKDGTTYTKPFAYVDARDVMNRLDAVVGAAGWESSFAETAQGRVICRLSVDYGDGWVTKADSSWTPPPPLSVANKKEQGLAEMEQKGVFSDAFKRAAVCHGVARYLYDVKATEPVALDDWGNLPRAWLEQTAPKLLPTYKPMFYEDWRKFTDAIMEHNESILKIKEWLAEVSRRRELQQTKDVVDASADYLDQAKAEWLAVSNEDKQALNRPWTKGGVWTPEETRMMKSW